MFEVGTPRDLGAAALHLSGDENTPEMAMTDAQVNHLRRLLAWMRCELAPDEDMRRGFLLGAAACYQIDGISSDQVNQVVQDKVEQINSVPIYVRQAVKMLTKALRDHERRAGVVDA